MPLGNQQRGQQEFRRGKRRTYKYIQTTFVLHRKPALPPWTVLRGQTVRRRTPARCRLPPATCLPQGLVLKHHATLGRHATVNRRTGVSDQRAEAGCTSCRKTSGKPRWLLMKFTVEFFRRSSSTKEHRGEKFFIDQLLSSAGRKASCRTDPGTDAGQGPSPAANGNASKDLGYPQTWGRARLLASPPDPALAQAQHVGTWGARPSSSMGRAPSKQPSAWGPAAYWAKPALGTWTLNTAAPV